jgi:hypothetical protein
LHRISTASIRQHFALLRSLQRALFRSLARAIYPDRCSSIHD